jgi:hypothetical protein
MIANTVYAECFGGPLDGDRHLVPFISCIRFRKELMLSSGYCVQESVYALEAMESGVFRLRYISSIDSK